jgi:carbon monoxide dehydrogenase subunit G
VPKQLHPCQKVDLAWLDRAQSRFSNDVDIALSPDELFGVLARADTWPRWAKVITHVEYTSPEPHGVGTTRVVTMRGGMVGDEEFLAWEPGRQMAFRFNTSATKTLHAFLESYRLEPIAGGTRLTWELGMETGGPSKVFAPVSTPITNVMFRRFLRNLQELCADGVPGVTTG